MNSRDKGKRGELELSHWLTERGHHARRGQQFSGGDDSPDVVCPSLAHIHIECKRVEAGNLYVWLAQAIRDAGPQKTPVVFHRRNDAEWVVVLRASDALPLFAGGSNVGLARLLADGGFEELLFAGGSNVGLARLDTALPDCGTGTVV